MTYLVGHLRTNVFGKNVRNYLLPFTSKCIILVINMQCLSKEYVCMLF